MIAKDTIHTLVEEKIKNTSFFIVEVKVSVDNKIQIFVDGEEGVKLENCMAISRHIEANVDRELEDYELEVSSAGIGLPFKVRKQYNKSISKNVEVITLDGLKFLGILITVNDDSFVIQYEERVKTEGKKRKVLQTIERTFSFNEVKSTREIIKV